MHKDILKHWQPEKTYKYNKKNIFKSKKTTRNKRLATKIVADWWELKVVVSRTEPIRIALYR